MLNFTPLKGWSSKVPQDQLLKYLKHIGGGSIGNETPDCSVINILNLDKHKVISTVDFFYPVVMDPRYYGRIACANVLSDLYAMGITNISNVLMILGISN